jgi:hypothetical protein
MTPPETHTPGPWQYHTGRGANPRLHIQTSGGYNIAATPPLSRFQPEASQQDANARLIVEAPEMYGFITNLRDLADAGKFDEVTAEARGDFLDALLARIRGGSA